MCGVPYMVHIHIIILNTLKARCANDVRCWGWRGDAASEAGRV